MEAELSLRAAIAHLEAKNARLLEQEAFHAARERFHRGERERHAAEVATLFVAHRRAEGNPEDVTSLRQVGHYKISRPTGGPKSISSCRFLAVIPLTSSSRV